MLLETNHLGGVIPVEVIDCAPDSLIGEPCSVGSVGEPLCSINDDENESVSHFKFWHSVKQYDLIRHDTSLCDAALRPRVEGDVSFRKGMQRSKLVNPQYSISPVVLT